MGYFSTYAKRVNEIARTTFNEIIEADNALKEAEEKRKQCPQRHGVPVDAEYLAKSARAEADYQNAKANRDRIMRNMPDTKRRELAALRRELAAAVDDVFAAKSADVDHDTLVLLESGILSASEYSRLLDRAENHTMRRLVAKYAADAAAEAEKNGDKVGARDFRLVAQAGTHNDGSEILNCFDGLTEIFDRCMSNHAMIRYWDELATPITDCF